MNHIRAYETRKLSVKQFKVLLHIALHKCIIHLLLHRQAAAVASAGAASDRLLLLMSQVRCSQDLRWHGLAGVPLRDTKSA